MAKKTSKKASKKASSRTAVSGKVRIEVVPHVPAAEVPGLVREFYEDGAIDVSVVPEEDPNLYTVIATFRA